MQAKIPKTSFTIFHMNIASLQLYIDDLKLLLNLLNHKFSVIGITETRIGFDTKPTSNIDIDGYTFKEIGTKSTCGGCALYLNNNLNVKFRNDLSKSIHDVGESIFYEVCLKNTKKFLLGVFIDITRLLRIL